MQKYFILFAIAIIVLLAFSSSKEFIVTGKITDDAGKPVASVSVTCKGNKTGTTSTVTGTYSIQVKDEKTILVFSAPGFKTKSIRVGAKRIIDVQLKATASTLDEVVVTGYETIKREDITGSMASVSTPQLNGQAAGVQSYSYQLKQEKKVPGNNGFNREGYDYIQENSFLKVQDNPLSTFSIDVDAASYSNIRRFINDGRLPPEGAVRIEEMINYFKYDYPQPTNEVPFSVNTEIAGCPWNNKHRLALIGLQGKTIPVENLPASNLVFLIDVSGSMMSYDKLPLVKQSMKLLTDQLRASDNVAIVVYAGNAGLVLPSTGGINKTKIKDAIDALEAGGSTAGGEGIKLAYKTAKDNFKKDGNNRVILCTDGDFNVGLSSDDELERIIEKERESGVFLTVLGFGTGNYQDAKMQKLADKGNGNHGYIDKLSEAKKMLISEFGGTLFTIASDVKLQIEFNSSLVQGYRLIGYENRMLSKEDFNDDKKDAGELGSGHTVTALYEIIPAGIPSEFLKKVDTLRYQSQEGFVNSSFKDELMTVKLRYKQPGHDVSKLIEHPVSNENKSPEKASNNFRFAAAVAEFGMLLRNSQFKQNANYEDVLKLAGMSVGRDTDGYRRELIGLAEKASGLVTKDVNKEDDLSKTNN